MFSRALSAETAMAKIVLKFIAVVLLVGSACSSTPETREAISSGSSLEKQDALNIRPFVRELGAERSHLNEEVCDLFVGEWIPNTSGPAYTHETCNFIPAGWNCLKNGRPDTGYLNWKWKPSTCGLPPFDPFKFLNTMRNKSWAFIGDSLLFNQVLSLVCLLSKVAEPYETHDHDLKSLSRTWYFPSHNVTLYLIWAPLLVQDDSPDDPELLPQKETHVHLDVLNNKWTTEFSKYNYVVISGGHWFNLSTIMYEKNQAIGCHKCSNEKLRELGSEKPYRKALQLSLNFIAKSEHKPFVILRTWTPTHYEHGERNTGGICNRTKPFKEREISGRPKELVMRSVEIEEFEKFAAIGAKNGVRMELLDTYHLSLLRPDGHPGAYGITHQFDGDMKKKVQCDCGHWCLPGPIDTWNELLLKMVIDGDDHDSNHALS